MEFLEWLRNTEIAYFIQDRGEAYYGLLAIHGIGMAVVAGVSFMLSARILGFDRAFPLSSIGWLTKVAWFGFAANAVSGAFLFLNDPARLFFAPAFRIKLILVVLAGVALWLLVRSVERIVAGQTPSEDAAEVTLSFKTKLAALAPVVLWLGAIVSGRLIGYTLEASWLALQ